MELFKKNIRHCLLPIRRTLCVAFSIAIGSLLPIVAVAQSPSIQTTADKKAILIGEQITVTLKASYRPGLYNIHWFSLPDSIPHFDVVDPGKVDTTILKDNSKAIEQTIVFTSFDSGKWAIPAFPIDFDSPAANDKTLHLFSDSVVVNVSYSPADSSGRLRDIKPIMDVTIPDYTWYYVAGGILLLCLIAFLIWYYVKKRKQRPLPIFTAKLSPYDEAIDALKKLDQYDLHDPAGIKMYHSGLSEIFKRYLGRKENKRLANQTTGELLIEVANNNFSQEHISILATALRCSDAVKFAKYLPTMIESADCKQKIKETIDLIERKTENPPTSQVGAKP